MNDRHFELVKVRGEFARHGYAETGEALLVRDAEPWVGDDA